MAKAEMPHRGHEKHLCYLTNLGYHVSHSKDYKELVSNPAFMCKYCGRVADSDKNLCKPVKL